jgi:DNA-directed RNA polymerase subunit RPC12/RpoP
MSNEASLSIRETCTWKFYEDEWSSYYETNCGRAYVFDFGTLTENNYKFCPYCGKRIVEEGQKE